MVEERETTLPRLLSPVSRMSQWSDIDELVDPVRRGTIVEIIIIIIKVIYRCDI